MASPKAIVVRDLVHRLSAQPQVQRVVDVDKHGHVRASSLEIMDLRDVVRINTYQQNLVEAVQELRSLALPRSSIGDRGLVVLMRAFKEGSRRGSVLRNLDLTNNGITQEGFRALTEALETRFLSGLENLIMSQNDLRVEGMDMLSKVLRTGHHSSLRGLDLSYCNVGIVGMVSLADALQSGNFSTWGLQSLDLTANAIGEHGVVSLTRAMVLGRLPELRFLSLSNNEFGEEGTLAFSNILKSGKLHTLTHLLLSRCYLSNAVVPIFEALAGVPNLEVLDVSGNHMGDHGSVALSIALRTRRLSRLHQLTLSQCGIGAHQMDFIMKGIEAGQVLGLRYLDLSYNHLDNSTSWPSSSSIPSNQGSVALVRLIQTGFLAGLELLDLSHCYINDLGLIALAESMAAGKLARLQRFLFIGNEIRSKPAIKALVRALESGHLAYLQELELGQNSVGEDVTMALASALTVSSARGLLVDTLKSRLGKNQKSSLAAEGTAGDHVKKIFKNRSFRALEVIKVAQKGQLPRGEQLYNRQMEMSIREANGVANNRGKWRRAYPRQMETCISEANGDAHNRAKWKWAYLTRLWSPSSAYSSRHQLIK